jgi:hypothetical protein
MPMWTKRLAAIGLMAALASGEAAAQTGPAIIQNFSAPGNLETTYLLGCIELKAAKSVYNPVDLFRASRACIAVQRYDDAVRLFGLARAFGRYDMKRVADSTAHQAVSMAQLTIFDGLPDSEMQKFNATFKELLSDDVKKTDYCVEVARIGPPSYMPRYMIQHGMSAFFSGMNAGGGVKNGLVENFDSKSAWDETLTLYLKCKSS